jgi:hypothetical protein
MDGLRGTATCLRSGEEVSFSDSESLIGFMSQAPSRGAAARQELPGSHQEREPEAGHTNKEKDR